MSDSLRHGKHDTDTPKGQFCRVTIPRGVWGGAQVAPAGLEMLKCPFFVPKDRPDDEPMLAIKEVNAPENQLLYSVCVLC